MEPPSVGEATVEHIGENTLGVEADAGHIRFSSKQSHGEGFAGAHRVRTRQQENLPPKTGTAGADNPALLRICEMQRTFEIVSRYLRIGQIFAIREPGGDLDSQRIIPAVIKANVDNESAQFARILKNRVKSGLEFTQCVRPRVLLHVAVERGNAKIAYGLIQHSELHAAVAEGTHLPPDVVGVDERQCPLPVRLLQVVGILTPPVKLPLNVLRLNSSMCVVQRLDHLPEDGKQLFG